MAIGWYPHLEREDLTVTLTHATTGNQVVYLPGDPAVRAVANLYPDPLARLQVHRETKTTEDPIAFDAWLLETSVTDADKEYSEKFILLDLPQTFSEGIVDIDIQSSTEDVINPLQVEILPGAGSPNTFGNWDGWSLDTVHLRYMERAPYYTIDFSTDGSVPHAIQIDLAHNPDASSGGVGVPYVVNPRDDLKSASWSDDGTRLRVILMPTAATALADIKHFKFYVTGGLTGLLVSSVDAYDVDGNPVVEEIGADVTPNL
jgi:hypothetical protein